MKAKTDPRIEFLRTHPLVSSGNRGFALVVTLSLMILLTVVAVGMLTLSSISLRAASSTQAMAEARQNAKMSMLLAISQLQSLSGQDTRVTASSNIIDPAGVTATGVWRSWEGSDHDSAGKPMIPKYDLKLKQGDPAKPVATSGEGRFLGWLTSTTTATDPDVKLIPKVSNASAPGMVPMVSAGSVMEPKGQVHITPTMLEGSKGAIAWWTSGDNSKAMVNADRASKPTDITTWQQRVRSNGRADAKTFGLEIVNDYDVSRTLPSTGSLELAASTNSDLRWIHDLTAFSKGLLTNTATGGWRKDLTLMSENYPVLPSSSLPFFTVTPGKDILYSKSQPTGNGGKPLLYPWTNYGKQDNKDYWWEGISPICSWSALVDFTQQYRNLPTSGTAAKTVMKRPLAFGFPNDRTNFHDKVRRIPQVARVQWIYSIGSRKVPGGAASAPAKYNPGIVVTPVLTLWNPYNVEITAENYWMAIRFQPNPLEFQIKLGAKTVTLSSRDFMTDESLQYYKYFHLIVKNPFTLAPGATMIFSTTDKIPGINPNVQAIVHLKPGYTPGGGTLYTRIDNRNEIAVAGSDRVEIKRITYEKTDVSGWGGRGEGFGMYFDVRVNDSQLKKTDYPNHETSAYISAHRTVAAPFSSLGGDAAFSKIYPPITNPVSATASSIDINSSDSGSIPNVPVASSVFCYRMASPFFSGSRYRYMYSKGLLQANPLSGYSDGFSGHPIHALYDFAFQEMNGWNGVGSVYPQWESSSGRSYIVSGLAPNDGLTRCVMVELPTRPIQSLPELQHHDARSNNNVPPYQFNIIGNGSAHPQFLPNQVFGDQDKVNDDTYLLNHLLFDDWFCSSIATDISDFGSATKRTAEQVYRDHLTLTKPLPNRLYEPARGSDSPDLDSAVSSAAVTGSRAASKDARTGRYPFETIASKLQVNGMFNINSVSLEAWKAILRQSRDTQVPYLAPDGSTKPGTASSFTYPRSSIAGDQGSDSGSTLSGSLFPVAAEFAGHRVLTEVQIDALAEEIVSEIQKRGPFLSLGEFVNRQLTSNKDLALASAIQTALDNLSKLGNSPRNPFAVIQKNAVEIKEAPPGNHGYKFPEAALGSSAFGVPGWVRQADILKPLAPIISARDDTFTIRAYGDSRKKGEPDTIVARAWCEVTVTRGADYVDPSDPAAVAPLSTAMKSEVNKRFGRRYQIVSFRWLEPQDI